MEPTSSGPERLSFRYASSSICTHITNSERPRAPGRSHRNGEEDRCPLPRPACMRSGSSTLQEQYSGEERTVQNPKMHENDRSIGKPNKSRKTPIRKCMEVTEAPGNRTNRQKEQKRQERRKGPRKTKTETPEQTKNAKTTAGKPGVARPPPC